MYRLVILLVVLLLPPPALSQARQVTAFVHVNVAPMDGPRVLTDQTVLVEGGVASAVAPRLAIPPGARVIDGHGDAFLSPRLADMHSRSDRSEDMRIYLASG